MPGHDGNIIRGTWHGLPVLLLAGRLHYYEGHSLQQVTFPLRVLAELGVESVLLTNAAGGIHPQLRVGHLMGLADHINFIGDNPLRGPTPNPTSRFVDLTACYDPQLLALLERAARQTNVPFRRGVYLAVPGPSYETPAEIRAFRRLGADAVGMSTAPETIVARQCGLRVAGLSAITNLAAGRAPSLSHQDVLAHAATTHARTRRLLDRFVQLYAASHASPRARPHRRTPPLKKRIENPAPARNLSMNRRAAS